jgi:endoglucanase
MAVTREVLSAPTAPFHEAAVAEIIRRVAAGRGWTCRADPSGNLWVRVRRGHPRTRWVFTAHMDHPAPVTRSPTHGGIVRAELLGGVGRAYLPGARVRFTTNTGVVRGVVERVTHPRSSEFPVLHIRLPHGAQIVEGTPGAWDLPGARIAGVRVTAPACDDLAGVAAILCALDRIAGTGGADVDVRALFTRAEEVGFIGAMAAARHGAFRAGRDWIVSVETSRAQPCAPWGAGVVIRAGDRVRVFDAAVTAYLGAAAETLAKTDSSFRFVRALMPGGVCESTVFHAAGLRAGAVCIPLANYHNQGPRNRLSSERIHLGDYTALIRLLAALPGRRDNPALLEEALKTRLHARFRRLAPRLGGADGKKPDGRG